MAPHLSRSGLVALAMLFAAPADGATAPARANRVTTHRHVAPTKPKRAKTRPSAHAAPKVLSNLRRKALIKKLVDAATWEKLGSQPLTLDTRLTPMTPRHESGAAIEEVSGMMWMNGSGPKWPDGMYFLSHVPDWNVMMDVALTLSFPTEVGQMYVVDCRVMAYELDSYRDGEVVVRSPRSPDIERRRITEGHLLDAFVATGAMSSFMLAPVLDDGLAFWGCDIGKVAGS